MFRIIESIPSKNAEPIKQWLAKLGSERIDEIFDPSISAQRAIDLAKEYKSFKGLRKESLRDNMSDIEVTLADLGELATREIAKKKNPKGLNENIEVARRGGKIAGNARKNLENEIGESVVTNNNALNYEYVNKKEIEMK